MLDVLPSALSPKPTFYPLHSTPYPGRNGPTGSRATGLFYPLASSWICPVRSFIRRLEGGGKVRSEYSLLAPSLQGCSSQLCPSAALPSSQGGPLHTFPFFWILVTFPSPCLISLGVVTALLALGSWTVPSSLDPTTYL